MLGRLTICLLTLFLVLARTASAETLAADPATVFGASETRAEASPSPSPTSPREPVTTAEDVLERARSVASAIKGKTMRVQMRVVEPSGSERVRTLRGYELHGADERKVLWVFESPADLAGTGFLAWQNRGEPDQLWVYFPGQRRVRRLPPLLRRESFQGSQLTYEDMAALFFFDYEGRHTLLGERECETGRCWVVDSILPEGEFAYRRLQSWIDAETFLPTRVDFYVDDLVKTMRVVRSEAVQGIPTIVALDMEGARDGYRTRVEFDEVLYDPSLDARLFTVEGLAQGGK